MKILVTGAAGFLGQGVVEMLKDKADLRLMDVVPVNMDGVESVQGSVENADDCMRALDGVDALVIAHMLSRTNDRKVYDDPSTPFNVNVTGTAVLMQIAASLNIKKVVLISSISVYHKYWQDESYNSYTPDMEPSASGDIYILTKVCQEKIAEFYTAKHGMDIAVLRVGGIFQVDDETREVSDKYGNYRESFSPHIIEPRDIGTAAWAALIRNKGLNRYIILGSPQDYSNFEVESTREELDWKPMYDFLWLGGAEKIK